MGCGSCSTGGGCAPSGCKSNGSCLTGGCQKMEVHDWLSNLDMPSNYVPFQVVEVKFKGARKEFFLNNDNIYLEIGELVAVEGPTGGYDIGHVSLTGELVRMQMKRRKTPLDQVTRKIYRKASEADVDKWKLAKDMEWETMHKARTLALDLRLSMKIKKMAETFRIRIEMRQIGMRQEAGRLGGIGSCGRELCCSTWLTNFKTVSTAAARYQNLSLNTLKLAGQCGKLKCCLNYELDTYLDALKDIPDRIDSLQTDVGVARHQKTDIFKKLMWFSYANQEDWIPLKVDRVKEIMAMNKRGEKPSNLKDEAVELKTTTIVEKVHDYENVVGQDSLTRLDDRSRNKNNRNKNNRNDRNPNRNGNNANPQARTNQPQKPRDPNAAPKPPQQARPNQPQRPIVEGSNPAAQNGPKQGNRNNRNRNKNRNKNRPTDGSANKPPTE